jgi:hypothetical protein
MHRLVAVVFHKLLARPCRVLSCALRHAWESRVANDARRVPCHAVNRAVTTCAERQGITARVYHSLDATQGFIGATLNHR